MGGIFFRILQFTTFFIVVSLGNLVKGTVVGLFSGKGQNLRKITSCLR